MQKYGSQSALSNRSAPLAPPSMSDPPYPKQEVTVQITRNFLTGTS